MDAQIFVGHYPDPIDTEDQWEVEISPWARIVHHPTEKPPGGYYIAYDRETDAFVGALGYFHLDAESIMFREVHVMEPYRRRKVAKALLRYLNRHHPDKRVNPSVRNAAGQAFMDHILTTEPEKVATNGLVSIPLQTLMPPSFRPSDIQERIWGQANAQ